MKIDTPKNNIRFYLLLAFVASYDHSVYNLRISTCTKQILFFSSVFFSFCLSCVHFLFLFVFLCFSHIKCEFMQHLQVIGFLLYNKCCIYVDNFKYSSTYTITHIKINVNKLVCINLKIIIVFFFLSFNNIFYYVLSLFVPIGNNVFFFLALF